jgi:hypothetical protein
MRLNQHIVILPVHFEPGCDRNDGSGMRRSKVTL